MTRRSHRVSLIALVSLLLMTSLVVVASPAGADALLSLTEQAPGQVLYGTPSTVNLVATNTSGTSLFNASFVDILPRGVSYIAGSSSTATGTPGDPVILVNQPAVGQTTLIWRNVADLQPSSTEKLTFQLQAATDSGPASGPFPILPGSTYTDQSSVYANSDARTVPAFDPVTGAPVPASSTNSATTSATTTVVPLQVALSQPWPQGEALRGVHDHQYTSTVTVTNNPVHGTSSPTVTVWIPAGLEFLGCGGQDNTTDAVGTDPGSTQEYPGSGSLIVGAPLAPSVCPASTSVTTTVDPVGPAGTVLSGVFTQVSWMVADLGTTPGTDTATIQYRTAIPLRSNSASWPGGVTPPTTGSQAANLDNNTGLETVDGQALTTAVGATGTYTGAQAPGAPNPVSAQGQSSVTAVDIAVQKAMSPANFVSDQVSTVSLAYQTSEYRYATGTVLTDTLPSGTCPLSSTVNYATDTTAANCAPRPGTDPSIPYSSVVENLDGSFVVTWNLGILPPRTAATMTFFALDRPNYVANGVAGAPVVSGDSLADHSSLTGTTQATCFTGTPPTTTPDPTCSVPGATPIFGGETTPAAPVRNSSAGQATAQPVLIKRISATPPSGQALNCASASYLTATSGAAYPPVYGVGDHACFQLEMNFPAGTYTHNPLITDFLPPNTSYVASAPTAANTVAIPPGNPTLAGTAPDSVTWTAGRTFGSQPGLYAAGGQVFEVDVEVALNAPPTAGNNFDLTANLAKATATNTAGQGISLRDQVTFDLSRPLLTLVKTVTAVNGVPVSGAPPSVHAGDHVTYGVVLTNTGLQPADNVAVWDNLPAQVTGVVPTDCTNLVSAVSSGGSCVSGTQVRWTAGVTVAAALLNGTVLTPATTTLSYVMTVPSTPAPGETLTNVAGVRTYEGPPPNTGNPVASYYPPHNIDPSAPADPTTTTRADGSATVTLPSVSMGKTVSTSVIEPGNDGPNQATVGENLTYTVTATVPSGSTVYSGLLTDPLGVRGTGRLNLVSGSVSATLNGGALPGGFVITEGGGNVPTIGYPATFGPFATDQTVSMTFVALVNDVPINIRGTLASNTAGFTFRDSFGTTASATSPSVATTLVEPSIALSKTDSPGSPYAAGATVSYTVTATNTSGSNVSTAHDLVVTDDLPAGMTPTGPVSDGGVATLGGSGSWSIRWVLGAAFTLAPGASKPLTFAATLPSHPVGQAVFTNNAAASVTSLDIGAFPGARTSGSGYAATAQDTVRLAGATLSKSASPSNVTIGVDTVYTVHVAIPADLAFPQLTVIDTLPDGMTFDAYGSVSCVDAASNPCGPDVAVAPVGTPGPAADGSTALAYSLGNVQSDPIARTVTVTYTAYPSKHYTGHGGAPVVAGQSLANLVQVYWQDVVGPPPTTVPNPSTYSHSSPSALAPVGVVEPKLTLTKLASTASPIPGVPFTYTLTVSNASANTSCAYGATVGDPLPAGLSGATSLTPSQGSATFDASSSTINWDPSVTDPACPDGNGLPPGASATLSFQTLLAPSSQLSNGQVITNTAGSPGYFGVLPSTASGTPSRYVAYGPLSAPTPVQPVFPIPTATKSTPGGTAAVIGTAFNWAFTLTAPSPHAPAYSLQASDTLPPSWTYDTGSSTVTLADGSSLTGAAADPSLSSSGSTQTLSWGASQLGDLPTSSKVIGVRYTATPQVGATLGAGAPNTNAVQATAADGTGARANASGPYLSNRATAAAVIVAADLSIVKSVATPGGFVAGSAADQFNLVVVNHGPSTAANPVVTDTLPNGAAWTFVSAVGFGWNCVVAGGTQLTCTGQNPLTSGTTAPTIQVLVHVPADFGPGTVTNSAQVASSTYDQNPANNSSAASAPVAVLSDLSVAKAHIGNFDAGSNGSYQVTVANNGPSDSPPSGAGTPIQVTDTLPAGMTFVSLQAGSPWTCVPSSSTVVVCHLVAGLPAGTQSSFTLVVAIASGVATGTLLTNHADLTGTTVTDPNPGNDHATDTVSVGTSADLSIVKHHDPADTFVPGTDVHYTLSVANAGPSDALTPVVTDALDPASFDTVVSAGGSGWSCTVAGLHVTCTAAGPLASGVSAQPVTVIAHVASGAVPGSIVNTASVASPTPDPVPANNSSTDTSASGASSADLSVTKTHVGSFTAGQVGTYSLTVANGGPSDAAAPMLVDSLPVGLTYASSTLPNGWTVTPGPIVSGQPQTVTFGATVPLTAGTAVSFTLAVAVAANVPPVTLTNDATVTSATPDPVPGNNTAADPTSVVTSADLAVTKTHAPSDTFTPGTTATYTLTVNDLGPSDAAAPVITDGLPVGLSFVNSASVGWSCHAVGQTVTCQSASSVAAGSASSVDLTVLVASSYTGGAFSNTGTVSSATPDPVPANNSSTDVSPVPSPSADLAIIKTHMNAVTPGSNATYALTVSNLGPSDAAPPVVTDTLPTGLSFVSYSGSGWTCSASGQDVTCTAATPLATGATSAVDLVVAVAASIIGTVSNTATVTSTTPDPNHADNMSTDATGVSPSADLSITKTHGGPLVIGTDVPYTLAVANHGPSDAAAPVVTDVLPAGLTFVSATGVGWSCTTSGGGAGTSTVTCTESGPLPAGQTASVITVTAAVGAKAYPSVTNSAAVTSGTSDPVPGNNTVSDPSPVAPLADLAVVKRAQGSGTVVAGSTQPFDLTVSNLGPTEDPGPLTIHDQLPSGLAFVSATGIGWTCSVAGSPTVVTCSKSGPFVVGATSLVNLVTTVGPLAIPSVTNSASVVGTATDPVMTNNSSSATVAVLAGSHLVLTKSLLGTTLTSGSRAKYDLTVANSGPSSASGVVVTDSLPVGLTYVSSSGTGWSCSAAGQLVTCQLTGELAVGNTSSLTLVVLVGATAGAMPIANTATVGSQTAMVASSVTTASTPPAPVVAATVAAADAPANSQRSGGSLASTGIDVVWLLLLAAAFLLSGSWLTRQRRRSVGDATTGGSRG
jgi:uncharacterized repeat protein (TIGR01451 family)/fimbrial isopeptide formation D2 family protein